MLVARQKQFMYRNRHELEIQPANPWEDHIEKLFNDESFFTTHDEYLLSGGIKRSDIIGIDPSRYFCERDYSVLNFGIRKIEATLREVCEPLRR